MGCHLNSVFLPRVLQARYTYSPNDDAASGATAVVQDPAQGHFDTDFAMASD